jgi:hypothetical protein
MEATRSFIIARPNILGEHIGSFGEQLTGARNSLSCSFKVSLAFIGACHI